MPITWRNIGSTVSGDEASLMTGAQDSMTAGFGAFNKVLEDRQKTKDDNWDQGKINNTNAFMNKLTGAETPEELAEMQKRGEFQAMLNQHGAQIDQGAARTALDGRGQVLQDRQIADIDYNNNMTLEQNKGARGDLFAAAEQNDQSLYDQLYGATEWANPEAVREKGAGIFAGLRDEGRQDRELAISGQNANTNSRQVGVAEGHLGMSQELHDRQMRLYGEQDQAIEDAETVSNVGMDLQAAWAEKRDANEAETNQIAIDLGAPVDNNGQAIIDPNDLELNAGLAEALSSVQFPTQTEFFQDSIEARLTEELGERPTVAQLSSAMSSGEELEAFKTSLSSTDRKRFTEQNDSIDLAYQQRQEDMDRTHQEQLSGNIFAEGQALTSTRINSAESVVDELGSDSLIFGNNTKKGLLAKMQDISMGGIEVRGKMRQVPAPLLNSVIRQVNRDWGSQSGNLEDRIRRVIDQNFDQYVEAETLVQQQDAERRELDLEKLRTTMALQAQTEELTGTSNNPAGAMLESVQGNLSTLERAAQADAEAEAERRAFNKANNIPESIIRPADPLALPPR